MKKTVFLTVMLAVMAICFLSAQVLIYDQPYNQNSANTSSSDSYQVADNFSGLSQPITKFVFYGVTADWSGGWVPESTLPVEPFIVNFYEYDSIVTPGLLAPTTGTYTISLYETYDSAGWNGSTLDVFVQGVPVLTDITLETGAGPASFTFSANAGDYITTYYAGAGGLNWHNSYKIFDPSSSLLWTDGPGIQGIASGNVPLEPTWNTPAHTFYVNATTTFMEDWGGWEIYRFEIDLPSPVNMGNGWISAMINMGSATHSFLWMQGSGGDLAAWQYSYYRGDGGDRPDSEINPGDSSGNMRTLLNHNDHGFELYTGAIANDRIWQVNAYDRQWYLDNGYVFPGNTPEFIHPADTQAEIWYDADGPGGAAAVYTGHHTPWIFTENDDWLSGTYYVIDPAYNTWDPVSVYFSAIGNNESTDFLGYNVQQVFEWTINVLQKVSYDPIPNATIWFDDGVNPLVGFPADPYGVFTFTDPGNYPGAGSYTVTAPGWCGWEPPSALRTEPAFTADLATTVFLGEPCVQTPVEMSSFTATLTADMFVNLAWITQSETNMWGYNVYRSETNNQAASILMTPIMYGATNTALTHAYNHVDKEVEVGHSYYYWLEAVEYSSSEFFGPVSVNVENNVPPVYPDVTTMKNAYPNPFTADQRTNIMVSLKANETGTLSIYNIQGQVVKSFGVNQGDNSISWDGRDSRGNACAGGIYFYKLETPTFKQAKKMVIVK